MKGATSAPMNYVPPGLATSDRGGEVVKRITLPLRNGGRSFLANYHGGHWNAVIGTTVGCRHGDRCTIRRSVTFID